MSWLTAIFGSGPSFSADREQYCPPYHNPCVSRPLEKKITLRLRMAARPDGQPGVIWVPEERPIIDSETGNIVDWMYRRDPDTTRVNILEDIRRMMDNPQTDRLVLLGIAPSWCTNEVIDPKLGGFIVSIENLFCGVAPHPEYTSIMEPFNMSQASSAEQEKGPPHPDDTGELQFFVSPGQRGPCDEVHHVAYIPRALPKGVAEFGGYEDVLLTPTSRPTVRDVIKHDRLNQYDDTLMEPAVGVVVEGVPDTHGAVESNDVNRANPEQDPIVGPDIEVMEGGVATLTIAQRDVPETDHELMSIDHPMMTFLNEFGETLRADNVLHRGDVVPVDIHRQSSSVRQKLHVLPTMYRVSKTALREARKWLCVRIYRNIRYTRLTRTGMRILMRPEQDQGLYEKYGDVLLKQPWRAPCLTLILHVEYILIRPSDRQQRLQNKAEL